MKRDYSFDVIFSFMRLALVTGMLDIPAVIDWADEILLKGDKPDANMIELSLSGKRSHSYIIWLLNHFLVESELDRSTRMLFALAEVKFNGEPAQAHEIILGLRLLLAESCLPAVLRVSLEDLDEQRQRYREGHIPGASLCETLANFLALYQVYRELLPDKFLNSE